MRVSAMWLGAIVVSSVIGGVVVVALITTSSGGDNRHVASATPAEKRPVKVVITGTESAKEEVTDGGIAAWACSRPAARSQTGGPSPPIGG